MRTIWILLLAMFLPLAAHAQSAADISAEVSDDKGFITRLLERNLSGQGRRISIDGFQGALSSRATFTQMTIADADGVWLTLENGAIQWNRGKKSVILDLKTPQGREKAHKLARLSDVVIE